MKKTLLLKYAWEVSDIEFLTDEGTEELTSEEKDRMRREDIRQKLLAMDPDHSKLSYTIQSLITKNEVKSDMIAYRLCFVPDLTIGEVFESSDFISTTVSNSFLKQLVAQYQKVKKEFPKPYIARIFIEKSTPAVFPFLITNKDQEEFELLLNNDSIFFIQDMSEKVEIHGEVFDIIDLDVTFAATDETYERFKDTPDVPRKIIRKHNRLVKEKKYN
jgi:hypothetical protein